MAKEQRLPWYAREWRESKDFSLEKAADRAHMSVSYLAELEKGIKRWNEDHLAALAHAYGIDPQDLFWNPKVGPPMWVVFTKLEPKQQEHATKILETFIKKTGTNN